MSHFWQVHEVQKYLSDSLTEVIKRGPQIITQENAEAGVVLSYAENDELRWLLGNGAASARGGVPPVGLTRCRGISPMIERVGISPTRFFLFQRRGLFDVPRTEDRDLGRR